MDNKRRLLSVAVLSAFVFAGLGGCLPIGFSRPAEDQRPDVLFVATTSEIRARFIVIDEISSVAVVKGLTPDTVTLSGTRVKKIKARYRVDIIHPETGEVYSVQVNGKRTAAGWGIDTKEVKAPF